MKIVENICFIIAVVLVSLVDWRLGAALFFYEINVSLMILREKEGINEKKE